MNYGPFYGMHYYGFNTPAKVGLFSRLFEGVNISSILNGTQKTLSFVNQIIPIVKQVQPIMANAKTMFKVMNEFKRVEKAPVNNTSNMETTELAKTEDQPKLETKVLNNNLPTFFM